MTKLRHENVTEKLHSKKPCSPFAPSTPEADREIGRAHV